MNACAHRLWYDRPAVEWTEALPVGNGRLGAMVFGGLAEERLQLNEATLWSGGPRPWDNPSARDVLPQVRAAVFGGRYQEAEALCKKMQGPYNQSYLPLADLRLHFPEEARAPAAAQGLAPIAEAYERDLDLDRAVAGVTHTRGGVRFNREVFSSHADQLIVVRLIADAPGRVGFTLTADSLIKHRVKLEGTADLVLTGRAPAHVEPQYNQSADPIIYQSGEDAEGMTFELRVRVLAEGGSVNASGHTIAVANADTVTLLVSAATSFNGCDKSPGREGRQPSALALQAIEAVRGLSYAQLLARHEADHRARYRRVTLELPASPALGALPTDQRIVRHASGGADSSLAALLFHYGRYLLIASSRPGGQPANLQGIWNHEMRPCWSSNWTININTQMNYWPAEPANLADCHEPLFDLIADLARNGRRTAEVNYGARGWVSHHNADLWRQTAPVGNYGDGDPMWANWCMSGAWLCQHLWEHYAFGGDLVFLRERAWPIMRGSAEFFLDWLVEDGRGQLVTAPSTSPEIGFITPEGVRGAVTHGSTMDLAIIHDLFTHCVEAARLLEVDADFAACLNVALDRLLPPRVGARGQLQEWAEDFMEQDVHHRHVSHLFGVHPGTQITPQKPELFAAARRALELRGDEGTGWSLAWKINFWARFRDGERAHLLIRNLLRPAFGSTETGYNGGGGVYPNLFDAHPPFQIDGNFGYVAGVCEMLVQSHLHELHLLPALPSAWPDGRVQGLRARGAFTIMDLTWRAGRLVGVTVLSHLGGRCSLRSGDAVTSFTTKPGEVVVLDSALVPVRGENV